MTESSRTGLLVVVTPVRIAVRLTPPLVADLLAHLVNAPGVEATIDMSTGSIELGTDILVTSEAVPFDPPPTVVVLGEPIAPGVATVLSKGATDQLVVADLASIASIVRDLCDGPK